jgi:hypothetical protein
MSLLAILSVACAVLSVSFSYAGGKYWGIYGVSLGLMFAQLIYFLLVAYSVHKKISLYRSFIAPMVVSIMASLIGFSYFYALQKALGVVDWRVMLGLWLGGFSIVCVLALWKGVRWDGFAKGS